MYIYIHIFIYIRVLKINCVWIHNIYTINIPKASKTQPTVPSPPNTIILTFGTSLNICNPGFGPPFPKLYTCLGFSKYCNLRSNLVPWRPPDFGFMNTSNGWVSVSGVIWKWFGAYGKLRFENSSQKVNVIKPNNDCC